MALGLAAATITGGLLVQPRNTDQDLASETGTTTKVLNPLESAPDSGDYASEMKNNLSELRTALVCK